MGLDCSLNGKSLDRWYVFSDEFSCGEIYTKKEFIYLIFTLIENIYDLEEQAIFERDYDYHKYWLKEALENMQDENIFYNENFEEYWELLHKQNIEDESK